MTTLSDGYYTPLPGPASSDDIAHDLVASAACVRHLVSEIWELKQQVVDLIARLQGQQHETEVGAEKATKIAIADRFDIPLQTLSDTEFDVAFEKLMENPGFFCRELEKFDSHRRVDNDQWSWRVLYNDLHGKHGGQAYFLNGDPDVRMTTEIS
ncbi:hypothetical protein HDU88_008731 [Geranomyces variabilis]|nr:hypothetical protein HDU88_008731 [Geranomyces variabilis]